MNTVLLCLASFPLLHQQSDGAPELGLWELAGRGGRDWTGTLVLEERTEDAYVGYIQWTATSGPDASGREPVEGAFDPATRTLLLHGAEIVDAVGNISHAEYRARVIEDGRRLVDGVWGGANVIPGTWSASWKSFVAHRAEVARTPHFAFHSHELLNLHHLLYQCAKTCARRDGEQVPGRPVAVAEIEAVDALEGEEREAWLAALAFYKSEVIGRDLLFDGELYELKNRLTAIEDVDGEWPEVSAEYAAALHSALPVYRARFWSAHDQANRAWIAAAVERLGRYESELVERMTSAYGGRWPDPPVRVDVCAYANWAGAYTTGGRRTSPSRAPIRRRRVPEPSRSSFMRPRTRAR